MIQATKNKAKSCFFLDAIRRCLCGRSADWLIINGRENPVSTLETGRYATVRFVAPSSFHLHFESLLSLLGSLRKPLKTKFTPAVSSVCSLSLSLSLRVSTLEKKSCPLNTVDPIQSLSSSVVMNFLRCRLSFSLLCSSLLCLRGSRSNRSLNTTCLIQDSLSLVASEGRLN